MGSERNDASPKPKDALGGGTPKHWNAGMGGREPLQSILPQKTTWNRLHMVGLLRCQVRLAMEVDRLQPQPCSRTLCPPNWRRSGP